MRKRLPPEAVARGLGQMLRYLVVGAFSNLCGYLVFLLLSWWGGAPKTAMTLVYVTAALAVFFGNRRWTFRHGGAGRHTALYYVLAHSSGYVLNLLLLYLFVDRFGYPHQWVQLGAMVVVALLLFAEFKYLVFREKV